MSVDWYTCQSCEEVFNDCGPMVWCECGKCWCSDECAEADGYKIADNENTDDCSCKYCRKEDATDSELLKSLMKLYGYSRESVVLLHFSEEGL